MNLGLMSFDDGSIDMPLVRLDMVRGRSPDQVLAVADAVQDALVEALGIPARDRFQIVTQHQPEEIIAQDAGLGFDRTPGILIIQIFTQRGRDTADKQRLYRTLADRLERAGVAGEDLFLSYMENGPDDWSFGFGRAQYVDGELSIPGRPPAST
ncbi:tautomerase family protein [Streptomyces sp. NPDC057062]|uniref:tautomerase family protein n=1 Tax=unclassified Streptomyces TaxID=2593676 RepID=UPI0027E18089|nr:tautomerase family protein [Streptomyces sp. MBT84]